MEEYQVQGPNLQISADVYDDLYQILEADYAQVNDLFDSPTRSEEHPVEMYLQPRIQKPVRHCSCQISYWNTHQFSQDEG